MNVLLPIVAKCEFWNRLPKMIHMLVPSVPGLLLSVSRIHVMLSRAPQRMTRAAFRCALRAHLGLHLLRRSPPAVHQRHDAHNIVDTAGTH